MITNSGVLQTVKGVHWIVLYWKPPLLETGLIGDIYQFPIFSHCVSYCWETKKLSHGSCYYGSQPLVAKKNIHKELQFKVGRNKKAQNRSICELTGRERPNRETREHLVKAVGLEQNFEKRGGMKQAETLGAPLFAFVRLIVRRRDVTHQVFTWPSSPTSEVQKPQQSIVCVWSSLTQHQEQCLLNKWVNDWRAKALQVEVTV